MGACCGTNAKNENPVNSSSKKYEEIAPYVDPKMQPINQSANRQYSLKPHRKILRRNSVIHKVFKRI